MRGAVGETAPMKRRSTPDGTSAAITDILQRKQRLARLGEIDRQVDSVGARIGEIELGEQAGGGYVRYDVALVEHVLHPHRHLIATAGILPAQAAVDQGESGLCPYRQVED